MKIVKIPFCKEKWNLSKLLISDKNHEDKSRMQYLKICCFFLINIYIYRLVLGPCRSIESASLIKGPLLYLSFKGQYHEKFCLLAFPTKHVPQPTDSYTKGFPNINSNSPRNLNSKPIPLCGPPRRIGFFLQARADHKHECYSLWVVLFLHQKIFHRLSL